MLSEHFLYKIRLSELSPCIHNPLFMAQYTGGQSSNFIILLLLTIKLLLGRTEADLGTTWHSEYSLDYDNLDKMDEMDHYNKLVMDPGTRCTANIAAGETFKTQQNFYNFSYDIQQEHSFIHTKLETKYLSHKLSRIFWNIFVRKESII